MPHLLLLTLSGDIHLKSSRTRRRFQRVLRSNITAALERAAPGATIVTGPRGRMAISAPDPETLDRAAEAAADVFGVYRVVRTRESRIGSLRDLADLLVAHGGPRVEGRTFSVRVRRRGTHDWSSNDAERLIGSELLHRSAGVDLDHPEVEVRAEVHDDQAFVVERVWPGADGLPLGTQAPVLSLLSGGFDSPVAAWMMMRRGCPVEFVHFKMDCAQSDHALAVGYDVWRRWGAGSDPRVWVVDFAGVKESLLELVPNQQRQVVLKRLMLGTADALAEREEHIALLTGEAVGQVSTQTVANLAEIDRAVSRPVLRPLAGLTKNEIIEWSRRVGSHDLSARAKEVCDLSDGPVDVAARREKVEQALAMLDDGLVTDALATRSCIRLAQWYPGIDMEPVEDPTPITRHLRAVG